MKSLINVKNSFLYAIRGLRDVVNQERNFRIHIVITAYILYFSRYYHLKHIDYIILIIIIALVMCFEIYNTALEEIVDYLSPEYSLFAKKAKDVSAGGVLLAAVLATVTGIIYFWKIDILMLIVKDIVLCWYNLLIFLISLWLSFKFIKRNNVDK